MKYIISGTNRSGSRTLKVSEIVQKIYADSGETVEIIALDKLPLDELARAPYGNKATPPAIAAEITKINQSEGLHIVVPEYNGSYPGALKLFIDHWEYPLTFEQRPVCFVGLGTAFGGLRPVEHLQQVFGYRNGFVFPHRVFIRDVFKTLDGSTIKDPLVNTLLEQQVHGFQRFTKALESVHLDANSIIARKNLPL